MSFRIYHNTHSSNNQIMDRASHLNDCENPFLKSLVLAGARRERKLGRFYESGGNQAWYSGVGNGELSEKDYSGMIPILFAGTFSDYWAIKIPSFIGLIFLGIKEIRGYMARTEEKDLERRLEDLEGIFESTK